MSIFHCLFWTETRETGNGHAICDKSLAFSSVSIVMCLICLYECTYVCDFEVFLFYYSIFRKRGIYKCINLMQLIFVANRVCAESVDILATAFTLFRIYPFFASVVLCLLKVQNVHNYVAVCFSSVALDYCIHIHNCAAAATAFNTNLLLQ